MFIAYVKELNRREVARLAAAFSYYATLAFFPGLICISAVMSGIGIENVSFRVLPLVTAELIEEYMLYVRESITPGMLAAAAFLLLAFSSASVRVLMSAAGFNGGIIKKKVFSVAAAPILELSFFLMIIGMTMGENIFDAYGLADYWRFAAALIFWVVAAAVLLLFYKGEKRLLAAVLASFAVTAISTACSGVFRVSGRYYLVYGTFVSFVIIMLWMYSVSIIIIAGEVLSKFQNKA